MFPRIGVHQTAYFTPILSSLPIINLPWINSRNKKCQSYACKRSAVSPLSIQYVQIRMFSPSFLLMISLELESKTCYFRLKWVTLLKTIIVIYLFCFKTWSSFCDALKCAQKQISKHFFIFGVQTFIISSQQFKYKNESRKFLKLKRSKTL